MRPISFENLRRLVGRKKDRNEPSFKRSESFKRISIRKSYLDRGKRRNKVQKTPETNFNHLDDPPFEKINGATTDIVIQDEQECQIKIEKAAGTIGYDEWIHDVNTPPEKIRDDYEPRQPPPRIRNTKAAHPAATQTVKTGSVTEELAVLRLDSSPVFPRCLKTPVVPTVTEIIPESIDESSIIHDVSSPVEGPPSVSVSLGRVWRDAVPVPFPQQLNSTGAAAHHSLDSGLKERKAQPTVARTVSAPEKSLSTSKDSTASSFSFSLSISRLADLRSNKNGFFRRKAPKPSPSVSSDGYFKRTSAPRRSSGRRRTARTSQRKTCANNAPKKILTKEIIRPASPVWFVPPEKRRSKRQRRVWREIRCLTAEEDNPLADPKSDDWSSNVSDEFDDHQLLLSGDFNERPDVYRQSRPPPPSSSLGTATSSSACSRISSTSSSKSSEGSGCPAPKISDFNEDKLFSEELRVSGILAQRPTWRPSTTPSMNYFASSQFLTFLTKTSSLASLDSSEKKDSSRQYRCFSSSDSEPEDRDDRAPTDNEHNVSRDRPKKKETSRDNQSSQQQKRAGPKRRPLRRKSQLKRANGGQPVYLVRKCSSLRRRPSKIPTTPPHYL